MSDNSDIYDDPRALQAYLEDEANPFHHDPSIEDVNTPLWREAFWPSEYFELLCSATYRGRGVPHGNGEPVLVIPGFLANDVMMLPLRRWLKRIGYRTYSANIYWNTDCPDKTATSLAHKARAIHRKTGHKVRLVGHSLGGMLAKSVLYRAPDVIGGVITLGSPFRDHVRAHPAVTGVWQYLINGQGELVGRNLTTSCSSGYCMCDFVRHMLQPQSQPVPQFAIYSRVDGVVDWESCIEEDPAANSEIEGATHIGLIYNKRALSALAQRLSQITAEKAAETEKGNAPV